MTNVQITEEVLFSYLNISSLSRYTMVRIKDYTEISSLMNQCFDMSLSRFTMQKTFFTALLKLTSACHDEIVGAQAY